uniref:zinc-dependent metalloprotease n=1 Tax=Phocaeicola sp. TaxID=2773926 RepID=UPI003FF14C0D
VYYIDPATPRKWVPYLKAGVEDWNAAFEAAGFKNAIQAREWGDDPTMSLDDARLSVIRYLPSEQENAYGPRIVDPRSGEIIDSHVCWYHNVMNLLKKWYMVQCGPLDKRARTMTFDDELMGSLIRFVSSHEVGHSLGLRHNMAASSATPVEKLRDKRWVEANGHTVSIMDYARFNYVAQPEDRISPRGLFPRIGVYDRWAVEWGYRWSADGDPWTEQEALRAEVTRRLKDDPRLFYVGDEGKGADPRSQSEDLGDNNMKANEYGIRNLRRVMEHILDWTRQPDGRHDDLQSIYNAVRAQYIKYVWHVQKNILGRYEGNLSGGRLRDFVGASRQREAVEWFGRNLFDAPLWLYPAEVVQCVDKVDPVTEIYDRQSTVLSYLLAPGLLANLDNASYVASEPYPVSDYLADVHRAVWRSTDGVSERTAYYTRQLERQYVRLLENMLRPATPEARNANLAFERSDARLAVQAHVETLAADVRERLAGCREGTTDYRHFRDLSEKLEKLIRPDEAAPKD